MSTKCSFFILKICTKSENNIRLFRKSCEVAKKNSLKCENRVFTQKTTIKYINTYYICLRVDLQAPKKCLPCPIDIGATPKPRAEEVLSCFLYKRRPPAEMRRCRCVYARTRRANDARYAQASRELVVRHLHIKLLLCKKELHYIPMLQSLRYSQATVISAARAAARRSRAAEICLRTRATSLLNPIPISMLMIIIIRK